jgi:hypothetical protein
MLGPEMKKRCTTKERMRKAAPAAIANTATHSNACRTNDDDFQGGNRNLHELIGQPE